MRLSGRPRHKPLSLERSNNSRAGTYALSIRNYGAIGRQVKVHPACPVRHDEEMRIRHRIVASHQVLVRREMPVKMGEPCLEASTKHISAFLWHALVEER